MGYLPGAASAMVLGDNIFFGHGLPELLAEADAAPSSAIASLIPSATA